jgi:hypothetical protein
MGSGYAGIENELFFHDNTMMLLADAKKMVEDIVKNLSGLVGWVSRRRNPPLSPPHTHYP